MMVDVSLHIGLKMGILMNLRSGKMGYMLIHLWGQDIFRVLERLLLASGF